jgi:hypothetical protein
MQEDIIGGSSKSIADELGNALVDAFAAGENAAEAFGDKVDDVVGEVIRKMLIQKLVEQPVGNIINKYMAKWVDSDGNFMGFDSVMNSTAKIEATVQFQQAGNYKIACVLVENNIENKETYNTFNHVLRAAQTDMEGDAVTPAVTAPEERTFNFEATIEEGWNAENCAFVVYVFKEEANGKYIVNNGAECTVDGSVDYRYEL